MIRLTIKSRSVTQSNIGFPLAPAKDGGAYKVSRVVCEISTGCSFPFRLKDTFWYCASTNGSSRCPFPRNDKYFFPLLSGRFPILTAASWRGDSAIRRRRRDSGGSADFIHHRKSVIPAGTRNARALCGVVHREPYHTAYCIGRPVAQLDNCRIAFCGNYDLV